MMPGVSAQMAEARKRWGAEHVARCWKLGVVQGLPGFFFAREGPIAVGTPWKEPELRDFGASLVTGTQSLLMLAEP